ncbi:type II secretion system protein [bacterium]|nr:type II secretion system protein [bacterium]
MNSGERRQFTYNSSLSTVHSHAFTLAETLIVMGIIGVVAALTIPNVNKNTGRAESITRFKKVYAELNEALYRATAVYGPAKTWWNNLPAGDQDLLYSQRFVDRLTEFMKVTKYCREVNNTGCLKEINNYYPSVILANGAGFLLDIGNDYLTIDIDGPNKGKGKNGIDIFTLCFGYDTKYENIGLVTDCDVERFKADDCSFSDGYAQWIMDNGNMDYLDIDNQGRCKNDTSKVLGYGEGKVQSCK